MTSSEPRDPETLARYLDLFPAWLRTLGEDAGALGSIVSADGDEEVRRYVASGLNYIFKSLERPLTGPIEVKFQVGAFDDDSTVDTGSACVEFDVQGSNPLQFYAVCGRRVNGGVQVFAQSQTGAQGNVFLAGARIAQVRVQYSGTQFICSAAEGAGAPDFTLSNFSTYNLSQGSTPLVMGLGASGLKKGAVIGLDEVYITPK